MWIYSLLGIIQGIFEWIPISSEGIVALVSQALIDGSTSLTTGKVNPIDIALFLHLGTLFAVMVYFRKDWKEVLMLRNLKLLKFLTISTVISLAVGYPLYMAARTMVFGSSLLLVMGFGLLLTAYFHRKRSFYGVGFNKLAVISGFLQGLAVIPGLSRSGSTIFGLSLGELHPSKILKISYMMSAPVVLASSIYLFLTQPALIIEGWASLITSFVVGILFLHFLIRIAGKINFFKFALFFSILCFLGAIVGFII